MIDNKIMYEIIEKLHESFSASISICDVSGRVIVSTDSSCMGEMNLLAIEALNINSKVTVSMDSKIQKAGAAMPLRFQKSRMGAVVLQGAGSSSSQLAEQDKYIGILGNQVVYVLRKKHLASRVHGKQYDDNRKSDNHCIFFQNL